MWLGDNPSVTDTPIKLEVLIVGGGIAGLWLLAELKAQGYRVLLVSDELGKGQTIASQGIIHGGTKYALTGKLTGASLAIGDMPRRWRNALAGDSAVDLSGVNVLAESQLLWTSSSIGSRLTGFFASHTMKSRMQALDKADYPPLFQQPEFHGSLYQLDEPVLDITSLLHVFRQRYASDMLQVDSQQSHLQVQAQGYSYQAYLPTGERLTIQAQTIVLTAGAGNAQLMQAFGTQAPVMQRRPLHMIAARGYLPMLYAHALGMSDKPRATITSYPDEQGQTVWYIGGQPAEQGVGKAAADVIAHTKQELHAVLPWMDFTSVQWATWPVDRAEASQADGSRPDQPVIQQMANVIVAWPTKLAFAPLLASQVIERLPRPVLTGENSSNLRHFTSPPLAPPIWQSITFHA